MIKLKIKRDGKKIIIEDKFDIELLSVYLDASKALLFNKKDINNVSWEFEDKKFANVLELIEANLPKLSKKLTEQLDTLKTGAGPLLDLDFKKKYITLANSMDITDVLFHLGAIPTFFHLEIRHRGKVWKNLSEVAGHVFEGMTEEQMQQATLYAMEDLQEEMKDGK